MIENGYTIEIDRLRKLTTYQQSIIESMKSNIDSKNLALDSVIEENYEVKKLLMELDLLICENKSVMYSGGRWERIKLEILMDKARRMLEK